MAKHLTLSDRIIIERGINDELTFATIARMINRSASTVSREVLKFRVVIQSNHGHLGNNCTKRPSCLHNKLCDDWRKRDCFMTRCKSCSDINCNDICRDYESPDCEKLNKPPYVCVGCDQQRKCRKNHAYYAAHRAHTAHEKLIREAHRGIRLSPQELKALGELIEPLIQKGQSLNHICVTHKDEIKVSEKTLYNYIDACAFKVRNIDLPKKVVYRHRRVKKVLTRFEYRCRQGRSYQDYLSFIEANPDLPVTEMDTIKGKRSGGGKVLLSLILTNADFMPLFLMKNCTETSVLAVFDHLTNALGIQTFRKLFPVILTDNGVEFKDPEALEYTSTGLPRTRIFYCDPQASWQKPHVEKNHTLVRRVIPKSTDLNQFTNEMIHLLTRHINSYYREEYGNKTPFEMMVTKEQKKLLSSLELSPIPPDEVLLKPALLKPRK